RGLPAVMHADAGIAGQDAQMASWRHGVRAALGVGGIARQPAGADHLPPRASPAPPHAGLTARATPAPGATPPCGPRPPVRVSHRGSAVYVRYRRAWARELHPRTRAEAPAV